MKKTDKASKVLARLWNEVAEKQTPIQNRQTTFTRSKFVKGAANGYTVITKQDIVGVDPLLLQSLDAGELKMVVKIIAELKMYNAFWHYDYLSMGQSAEKVIGRLRRKNVLFRTENLAVHIVNPWKIKRGAIDVVVASTTKLLEESSDISHKLFKHLEKPDKSAPNAFHTLTLD